LAGLELSSGLWVCLESRSDRVATGSAAEIAASGGGWGRGWVPRALQPGRLAAELWRRLGPGWSAALSLWRQSVMELRIVTPWCWPLCRCRLRQGSWAVTAGERGWGSSGRHGQGLPCQGAAQVAVKVSTTGRAALSLRVRWWAQRCCLSLGTRSLTLSYAL